MSSLIELKNISKYYIVNKKTVILKKINYKFKKGLIYSLVGPSGSGKSTLLNLLSLIDKPSSGEIIINNNSTKYNDISQNDQLRADKIGIIYQQNNLLPDFNALENVYLARLAIDNNKNRAILEATKIIKKKHITNFFKSKNGFLIQSISFNSTNTKIGEYLLNYKKEISVIGQIKENFWNNKSSLQLTVRDLII